MKPTIHINHDLTVANEFRMLVQEFIDKHDENEELKGHFKTDFESYVYTVMEQYVKRTKN